jgi:hypothetical protein
LAKRARRNRAWTLAGAARAAREARIATVRYLQTPAALVWEMGRLAYSQQIHLADSGDPAEAAGRLFGGMGYSDVPSTLDEATRMVLADEARYLAEADLYVLTPEMCDVVVAAAQALTRDDLESMSEDDLPGLSGLVVLPHPVIVRTMTGGLGDDRAYTWRCPARLRVRAARRRLREIPAVRMSAYHDSHGPVRPDSFVDFAAHARAQGTPLPPLLLDVIRCLPLQYAATPDQARAADEFVATARRAGDSLREMASGLGLDEGRVVGEYQSGAQVDDPEDTFMPRFLYAFWRLCEQRIAAVERPEAGHSARVVAERAGVPAEVRVVRLRRAESHGDSGQGGREWHHRWVVRMHKVRQFYPSLGRHKVIYRGPYIKGPEDKPLLGGETVRGLVR